jgi:hypothetical protein
MLKNIVFTYHPKIQSFYILPETASGLKIISISHIHILYIKLHTEELHNVYYQLLSERSGEGDWQAIVTRLQGFGRELEGQRQIGRPRGW